MTIDPAVIVSVTSAVIAGTSAVIAFRSSRREQLNQKIQAAKWQKEYFSDLVKWSDESMLLLSDAMHLCELDQQNCEEQKFFDSRHTLRIKLSAQIDRGRWFFPNEEVDQHGRDKEEGFRGYRHQVLDQLVFAYRAVTKLKHSDISKSEARTTIEQAKRAFTGQIQKILAPRARNEEFTNLTASVGAA